ncbi:MAG: B12-binding domain-containing radical SAM protein [Elusimicrobia bacterium]|nr:B12-binding domain-containing radical SAM protein [Elusimicrobiota bacterium]
MKILIAQPYFRVLDPAEWKNQMPYPALSALYAATVLRGLGHDIHFFDGMLASRPKNLDDELRDLRPDLFLLLDDDFNYLTKMCLSNMRRAALKALETAQELGIAAFIHSSDAADHPRPYLERGAWAVILQEAESALPDVITAIEKGNFKQTREKIPGLLLGGGERSPKREALKDLDLLPEPDYDFVDLAAYRKIWIKNHGYFSLNISTARGCPFGCNWCAKPLYGQAYHSHSPARVAGRMRRLSRRYNADHFWITDDIFGLKPGWLREFARECASQDARVPYKCLSRADLLLRDGTVELLKRSGCRTIWLGAESGSQKVLNAMEKGVSVEQIYEAARLVRRENMEIAFFLQIGYPEETWDDISLTRKMVRDLTPDGLGISVSYPLPGTKFFERVSSRQLSKTRWTHSKDLDLLFAGTYGRQFYRFLQRFIHAEHRIFRICRNKQWRQWHRLAASILRWTFYGALLAIKSCVERPARPAPRVRSNTRSLDHLSTDHSTARPLYHSTTLPPYHSITLPLYHSTTGGQVKVDSI